MQIFQILMGGMDFRERTQKKTNVLSSEEWVVSISKNRHEVKNAPNEAFFQQYPKLLRQSKGIKF